MNHPENMSLESHPRRILVAVTGLSPQIVTETLYALAVQQAPAFMPTEVRLITTEEGAQRAQLSLLHEQTGWFHRLRSDYGLPPIKFGPTQIQVLKGSNGNPLSDIRSVQDNTAAADAITDMIRELTGDDGSALHVSIAGGRKTMGFYLGYALSLYGRIQDRLSHVLVNAPYESHPGFFYPTPESELIHTLGPNARPYDARDAKVTLAEIPFVRLRGELPEGLLDGKTRFTDAVDAAQRAIGPRELIIDLPGKRLCAGGRTVSLPPKELAFIAWLARRQKEGSKWLECPLECPKESPLERDHAEAFLAEYGKIIGVMGHAEPTEKRLDAGMSKNFFSQTKSKLHRILRQKLGRQAAAPYLISRRKERTWLHGLYIAPSAIHFKPLEGDDEPAVTT